MHGWNIADPQEDKNKKQSIQYFIISEEFVGLGCEDVRAPVKMILFREKTKEILS